MLAFYLYGSRTTLYYYQNSCHKNNMISALKVTILQDALARMQSLSLAKTLDFRDFRNPSWPNMSYIHGNTKTVASVLHGTVLGLPVLQRRNMLFRENGRLLATYFPPRNAGGWLAKKFLNVFYTMLLRFSMCTRPLLTSSLIEYRCRYARPSVVHLALPSNIHYRIGDCESCAGAFDTARIQSWATNTS